MLSGDENVQRCKRAVERVLNAVCEPDEFPWFVSDEATVFDVSMLGEGEILSKLMARFGVPLQLNELKLPLWRLAEKFGDPED